MTAPNQSIDNNVVKNAVGLGAWEIGGGGHSFGQDITESFVHSLIIGPASLLMGITGLEHALERLGEYLATLPLEALQMFQGFIPGKLPADFVDAATAISTILTSMLVDPLGSLRTALNQIGDIVNGLFVVPITDAIAHFADWFHNITAQAQQTADDVGSTIKNFFNGWFGGTSAAGHPTEVSATIESIKTTITGGWTIELLTTSGTWTRPAPVDQILEFWIDGFSAGSGAGRGDAGLGARVGGTHGVGGRFYSKQIVDPSTIPSTVAYTVPAGGAPTNAITPTDTRADAVFGSLFSTADVLTASIASMSGLVSAVDSKPADGGDGGTVDTGVGRDGYDGNPAAFGVAGGTGGAGNNAGAGGAGAAGGNANLVTDCLAGGAGGAGGGGGLPIGGNGGNGGFPGGGAGGSGACAGVANAADGGYGGNAVIRLRYKLVAP